MSKIEWTKRTWNVAIGCRRVSSGCERCYAETMAGRIVAMSRGRGAVSPYERVVKFSNTPQTVGGVEYDDTPRPRWNGRAVFLPDKLDEPLRWREPQRVFVNSMSDLFHEDLDFEQIAAVFGVMAAATRHTFQVLTKRPKRALEFFEWLQNEGVSEAYDAGGNPESPLWILEMLECYASAHAEMPERLIDVATWPLPNVHLGVSAEDQATADERIPLLLQCPAAVRWVSAEPLLGPIDFKVRIGVCEEDFCNADVVRDTLKGSETWGRCGGTCHGVDATPGLDWVVVGGESGSGARPCDIAWVRSIVEQCREASVPVFVKQLGGKPFRELMPDECGTSWNPELRDWRTSEETHRDIVAAGAVPIEKLDLTDRKGADPDEWPADLRVRQYPKCEEPF